MCGRAKLPDDVSEIKLDLKIDFDQIGNYRPRWNAAPTSKLPVVVSAAGSRILTLMRWGLVPSWAKDLKIGFSTFNARAESLTTRAAFRGAWQAGRRCLSSLTAITSGATLQAAVRSRARQPRPHDAGRIVGRLAIADGRDDQILRHNHHDCERFADPRARTHACCHSAGLLGRLAWGKLDTREQVKTLLRPYPDHAMAFWPVDRRVGNVRNDSPDLFAPIELAP